MSNLTKFETLPADILQHLYAVLDPVSPASFALASTCRMFRESHAHALKSLVLPSRPDGRTAALVRAAGTNLSYVKVSADTDACRAEKDVLAPALFDLLALRGRCLTRLDLTNSTADSWSPAAFRRMMHMSGRKLKVMHLPSIGPQLLAVLARTAPEGLKELSIRDKEAVLDCENIFIVLQAFSQSISTLHLSSTIDPSINTPGSALCSTFASFAKLHTLALGTLPFPRDSFLAALLASASSLRVLILHSSTVHITETTASSVHLCPLLYDIQLPRCQPATATAISALGDRLTVYTPVSDFPLHVLAAHCAGLRDVHLRCKGHSLSEATAVREVCIRSASSLQNLSLSATQVASSADENEGDGCADLLLAAAAGAKHGNLRSLRLALPFVPSSGLLQQVLATAGNSLEHFSLRVSSTDGTGLESDNNSDSGSENGVDTSVVGESGVVLDALLAVIVLCCPRLRSIGLELFDESGVRNVERYEASLRCFESAMPGCRVRASLTNAYTSRMFVTLS
jgi:hypothetical protein